MSEVTLPPPAFVPRLRLGDATHHLAALAASGHWGRQMRPAEVSLPQEAVTGYSRERGVAEAIRLIAETVPLRLEPEELLVGASLYAEARGHAVPIARIASISHVTVDFGPALRSGYAGLRAQIEERLRSGEGDARARDFWESQLVCLAAACRWHDRYRALLRERLAASDGATREHYRRVLAACETTPERPPRTFHEAVQALWSMWEFQRVCGNWSGLGRIDELLGPYLEADLAEGRLALDEAREILAHFLIKGTEWRTGEDRNSGDAQNYQNIILGGLDANGREVCNEVTYLVLDLIQELRISEFPVTVRVSGGTPERLWRRTAEVMRLGGGVVAIYNEDVILAALARLGLPAETARTFTNDGCWEIIIPGRSGFSYLPFDCVALLQETLGLAGEGPVDGAADFEMLYADFLARLRETILALRRGVEAQLADAGVPRPPFGSALPLHALVPAARAGVLRRRAGVRATRPARRRPRRCRQQPARPAAAGLSRAPPDPRGFRGDPAGQLGGPGGVAAGGATIRGALRQRPRGVRRAAGAAV